MAANKPSGGVARNGKRTGSTQSQASVTDLKKGEQFTLSGGFDAFTGLFELGDGDLALMNRGELYTLRSNSEKAKRDYTTIFGQTFIVVRTRAGDGGRVIVEVRRKGGPKTKTAFLTIDRTASQRIQRIRTVSSSQKQRDRRAAIIRDLRSDGPGVWTRADLRQMGIAKPTRAELQALGIS